MKKFSRMICKILAFSCIFTINMEMLNIKVSGMDLQAPGPVIAENYVEKFFSEQKSPSIIEAIVDNDIAYLKHKGYKQVYGTGINFPFCAVLKYQCYKNNLKNQEIITGKFNELLDFLVKNNKKEFIYILANLTGLSLNVILCYLMTLEPAGWSIEIDDLLSKFSKLSKKKLNDEDKKLEIANIVYISKYFFN